MLDVIKLVVESVIKLIPAADLLKTRRADQVAEIGLRLFDFYGATITVADNGNKILERLDLLVRAHREREKTGLHSSTKSHGDGLTRALTAQSKSVDDLIRSFKSLQPIAEIVDRGPQDTFLELAHALSGKRMILSVAQSSFTTSPSGQWGPRAEGFGPLWLFSEITAPGDFTFGGNQSPEEQILTVLQRGKLAIDKIPWDPGITEIAELYLDSGIAARRLNELVDLATSLRTSFQSSFDLRDVLLARERQLKRTTA